MDELIQILADIRPDVDFRAADKLVTDGVIESLDMLIIIGEISERFGVDIGFLDIKPENFDSAQAMYRLIQQRK